MKKKRKQPAKPEPAPEKPKLADAYNAAVRDGAISFVFDGTLVELPSPRLKLSLTQNEWPGNPGNRLTLADMEYTDKQVAKLFVANPSTRWIITPYEIIERTVFLEQQKQTATAAKIITTATTKTA